MVPLGELAEVKPPKREAQSRIKPDQQVSFVPMEDLKEIQRKFAPRQVRSLSEVYGAYTYFAEDDVLLAKITPCFENGKLAVARGLQSGVGFGSSEFMVLRCGTALDPDYLFYFLSRDSFRETGKSRMTGAVGHKRVPPEFVQTQGIPLPPLEEQKRIVAILDEAFEGLSRARANAEANLADADQLFGAALDRIYRIEGASWPTATLPSVCREFGRGKSRHRPRNDPRLYDGPYPFIQTGDISRAGHLLTDFEQTYSDFGLQQSKLWSAGTVCVAIVGATIGESAVTAFDCCFPDSIIGMTPDPHKADAQFVEYALCCFKAELKKAGKGSARDNINLATFEARQFPMPDIQTQRTVVERLKEISCLKEEAKGESHFSLAALDTLRESFLQKAFSGQLT